MKTKELNLIEIIWRHRQNSIRKNLNEPNFVMIHPIHKGDLYQCAMNESVSLFNEGRLKKIFGMQVIWTDDIEESEIIPTFR